MDFVPHAHQILYRGLNLSLSLTLSLKRTEPVWRSLVSFKRRWNLSLTLSPERLAGRLLLAC